MSTAHGPVKGKCTCGWGVQRQKPKFEDLAKIAKTTGKSLSRLGEELVKTTKKN